MERPDRHLKLVAHTDIATVKKNLDAKEQCLMQAVMDADDFESLDQSCRALLAYWDPAFELAPVKVAATRAGGDHGAA